FPARLGRKRRFIPEIAVDPALSDAFKRLGFKKAGPGYKTLWLDLGADLDVIREGFHGKWRNMLRRAEDTDLMVERDDKGLMLDLLLAAYSQDKASKNYAGATPEFIRAMESIRTRDEYSLILTASKADGPPLAMMYFRLHGRSATYQIGWSNEDGRASRAHHLLLWHAIGSLKSRGIKWLDLGGINPEQAEGVTRFKKGLGGESFETLGLYS
ncbi:MAG: GNAT family N-acetyltransferase, partial [Pseudomonadota bacterium]